MKIETGLNEQYFAIKSESSELRTSRHFKYYSLHSITPDERKFNGKIRHDFHLVFCLV